MVLTIACLTLFELTGVLISSLFNLPVPGPVIGMVLFVGVLICSANMIEKAAPVVNVLLGHFSLLFVPAGVGIMDYADRIIAEWLPICVAVLGSSILTMVSTVLTIRWVSRLLERRQGR